MSSVAYLGKMGWENFSRTHYNSGSVFVRRVWEYSHNNLNMMPVKPGCASGTVRVCFQTGLSWSTSLWENIVFGPLTGAGTVFLPWSKSWQLLLPAKGSLHLQHADWIHTSECAATLSLLPELWFLTDCGVSGRVSTGRGASRRWWPPTSTTASCGKRPATGSTTVRTCFHLNRRRRPSPSSPWTAPDTGEPPGIVNSEHQLLVYYRVFPVWNISTGSFIL